MASSVVAIPRDSRRHGSSLGTTTDDSRDNNRWRLVLARATVVDFLYAVLSTRIFCLPSCPSRRPRRANVRYFTTAAEASAAGFRPCRRCRPDSVTATYEGPSSAVAAQRKAVETACAYVHERAGDLQLADLADHVGLSARYFHGLFKQIVGVTPGVYAARVRRERAVSQMHLPQAPNMTESEEPLSIEESADPAAIVMNQTWVHDTPALGEPTIIPELDPFGLNLYGLTEPYEAQDLLMFDDGKTLQWDWNTDLGGWGSSAFNIGTAKDEAGGQISECVDPTLLMTHRTPSQFLAFDETPEYIDPI